MTNPLEDMLQALTGTIAKTRHKEKKSSSTGSNNESDI